MVYFTLQVRACEHIHYSPNLFAAPQCLGYQNERGVATTEMCLPSRDTIVRQLKRVLRSVKDAVAVFVASDNNHMITDLTEALKRMEVSNFFIKKFKLRTSEYA
jgi:peptide-O-fucosyltransferase